MESTFSTSGRRGIGGSPIHRIFIHRTDPSFLLVKNSTSALEVQLITIEDIEAPFDDCPPSLFVSSSKELSQESVIQLKNSGVEVCGIITSKSPAGIIRLLRRILSSKKKFHTSGWVCGNEKQLLHLPENVRKLNTDIMSIDFFLGEIGVDAMYGILIGHGREDVCYWEHFAICGQECNSPVSACAPTYCHIPKPKINMKWCQAGILLVLSCLAGKIGHGLFPAECKLSSTYLASGGRAVIAPTGLLTVTPELVITAIYLIESGVPASQIALQLHEYQREFIGEFVTFNVFGDPTAFVSQEYMGTKPSSPLVSKISTLKDRDQLLRYLEGLTSLATLKLLSTEAVSLRDTLQYSLDTLGKLSYQIEKGRQPRSRFIDFYSEFREECTKIENEVAMQLFKSTNNGYFWLLERYDWFERDSGPDGQCGLCGSRTTSTKFSHPLQACTPRLLVVCENCGVIEDRDTLGVTASVTALSVLKRQNGSVGAVADIKVSSFKMGKEIVISINVNNAANSLKRSYIREISTNSSLQPFKQKFKNEYRFQIELDGCPPGVYILKIFLLSELHLTIASAPISTLNSQLY